MNADTMNWKHKGILLVVLTLALLLAGCGGKTTPYQENDDAGYCVSVRYDANGGTFTTNTSVIVDAYALADLPDGENGQAKLALLPPDDPLRGSANAFTPVNNGYFLAGWYTGRTENGDGTYTYSGRWDFAADVVELDRKGSYSSEEPVLTLYAAWVPLFQINYYDMDGTLLTTSAYNPLTDGELTMPVWEDAALKMGSLPEKKGFTFEAAYLDAQGTKPIETPTLAHTGSVDLETCQTRDSVMNVYMDFIPGQWFHIYNAGQFLENASVAGCYILHEDLDFTDKIWPTALMYGNFTGTIEGNGHTIRNVTVEQTNSSKTNAGLFGQLGETAVISDLKLENISFVIRKGAMKAGTNYGLLAGSISPDARLSGVTVENSRLLIDSACHFGTLDYAIGLICGMGETDIGCGGVECLATGSDPDKVTVETSGNAVNVKFADQ